MPRSRHFPALGALLVAVMLAIVSLRRDRSVVSARIGLALASLTLLAEGLAALMLFWPTER